MVGGYKVLIQISKFHLYNLSYFKLFIKKMNTCTFCERKIREPFNKQVYHIWYPFDANQGDVTVSETTKTDLGAKS